MASLGATFIIEPLLAASGMSSDAPPPIVPVLLGMLGVLISAAEPRAALRRVRSICPGCTRRILPHVAPEMESHLTDSPRPMRSVGSESEEELMSSANSSPNPPRPLHAVGASSAAIVLAPTLIVAGCTALWNVSQRYFNDMYAINMWSYVAIDQVTRGAHPPPHRHRLT